jgi:hypothetical protein
MKKYIVRNYCSSPCPAYSPLVFSHVTKNGSVMWNRATDAELAKAIESGRLNKLLWAFSKKDYRSFGLSKQIELL